MDELELADQKWLREHDLAGALLVLDGLLSREPGNEKALNFAGWLRTTQRADDTAEFERGVQQLKAALALAGGPMLSPLRSAIARREWDAAFAALEAIDRSQNHGVETVAGIGELLGDRLQRLGRPDLAARAFALSEDAFSEFASWSSSGAEGMGRMLAVNRLRAKQGLPKR